MQNSCLLLLFPRSQRKKGRGNQSLERCAVPAGWVNPNLNNQRQRCRAGKHQVQLNGSALLVIGLNDLTAKVFTGTRQVRQVTSQHRDLQPVIIRPPCAWILYMQHGNGTTIPCHDIVRFKAVTGNKLCPACLIRNAQQLVPLPIISSSLPL